MYPPRHNLRKKRAAREGAVLLIVLLIIMMATGTAMFAISSSQFDQRASAAWHQATRTKYVAEAATVALIANCQEQTLAACTGMNPENGSILTTGARQAYGLPSAGLEPVYSVTRNQLANNPNLRADGATDDDDFRLSRSLANRRTVFLPSFISVAERWPLPKTGSASAPIDRFRLVVSTYGAIDVAPVLTESGAPVLTDARSAGNEERWGNGSVSITRAIIDER